MSKYDDCHRVDNRYTTAIGMSVWRFFNIGKYKNQKVKDVCYFNHGVWRAGRDLVLLATNVPIT